MNLNINILFFVWIILFAVSLADSDDDDSDDGDNGFSCEGISDASCCPCWPGGSPEILAACFADVGGEENINDGCSGIEPGLPGFGLLFCGRDPDPLVEGLSRPVFAEIPDVFGASICVRSDDGILGLIRAIFEAILEFIDDLEDCFDGDDRRRLQGLNTLHGDPDRFQYFIELLINPGTDKPALLKSIFAPNGIYQLAETMRRHKNGQSPARKLLDDSGDDDDDFDECGFGFLFAIFSEFPEAEFAGLIFEEFIADLLELDCDSEEDFNDAPIRCTLQDVLLGNGDSGDDDSDDDDDGDGPVREIIPRDQLGLSEGPTECFDTLANAFSALDGTYTDGCEGLSIR